MPKYSCLLKDKLIEECQRIGINGIIRQNNGNIWSKKSNKTRIKMINISVETYNKNCVETIEVKKEIANRYLS